MRILALDPSVMNRCGWATAKLEWRDGDILTPAAKRGPLITEEWDWGSWEISGMNFRVRCTDLKDYIAREQADFDFLVCEWPMFYGNERGRIAAQQGYTINLAGIVMYIAGWFQVHHQRLTLYTAPDWKGTVKKAVTARRFLKLFGLTEQTADHDSIDAVMMLVYHCKKLGLI